MFLNWIGKPSIYLPVCMIIWGAISCLTGGSDVSPMTEVTSKGILTNRNYDEVRVIYLLYHLYFLTFIPEAS